VGLANPNMVASSHIRRYIRAIEEIEDGEEIEKYIELRNRWSRGLHVWIPSSPCFVEIVYWLRMHNLLLVTDVYCLFPC
jgi:hypothetical protein